MGTEVKMVHGDVTELRLGLPGGGVVVAGKTSGGKRGFSETEEEVELKLNLSGVTKEEVELKLNLSGVTKEEVKKKENSECKANNGAADPHVKPPAKAQVVGWPPVRSYRKKRVGLGMEQESEAVNAGGGLVKVSMDGAPYLRKVDLSVFKTYQHLSAALANMFSSRNYANDTNLVNASDYVPTYEDKDGDWMLIGDVPWEMFVGSCKRLRIMKGKEAVGLAPRAMEKCKRRS